MTQSIPLIDKSDNFQIIGAAIASILATETVAQQALAVLDSQDPALYKFNVYRERINPWEAFRDGTAGADLTPIVNVWYESSRYDKGSSNVSTRQTSDPSRYNIDVYAYAASAETVAGHDPGDKTAALLAQNICKLVRNILMHDKYKKLGLDASKTVGMRWPGSMTAFQPQSGNQPVQRVVGCRFELDVKHIETTDLEDEETLSILNIKMRYEDGGKIIAELEYGP
jgi:hypothetical protein